MGATSGTDTGSVRYFELLAECSVALGGFAAVHAVLRGSTGPRGTFRAWGSVSFAFSALLMSLAPLLTSAGEELSAIGWRVLVEARAQLERHGRGAVYSFSASQRSLSMAAMQPVPAAVTAWR